MEVLGQPMAPIFKGQESKKISKIGDLQLRERNSFLEFYIQFIQELKWIIKIVRYLKNEK